MKRNNMRSTSADWSTIDLTGLKPYRLMPSYHLSEDMGAGCCGDPPGYPTYFLRSVYTKRGDLPDSGPQYVFTPPSGEVYAVPEIDWDERDDLYRALWKPLPLHHPRTQAWIKATFKHHNHCYQVPELRRAGKSWSDSMLIWPGGCCGNTPFGRIEKDPTMPKDFDKWTEAHQQAHLTCIQEENRRVTAECERVAIPENHDGTIIVRRYYPEFDPTSELIAAEFDSPGDWWDVMSERPTPETCPGSCFTAHPANGNWCQRCGWHEKTKTETKANS